MIAIILRYVIAIPLSIFLLHYFYEMGYEDSFKVSVDVGEKLIKEYNLPITYIEYALKVCDAEIEKGERKA